MNWQKIIRLIGFTVILYASVMIVYLVISSHSNIGEKLFGLILGALLILVFSADFHDDIIKWFKRGIFNKRHGSIHLTFFHNSVSLIETFSLDSEPHKQATYYWVNTHYIHYQPWHERYFYLFIKRPKTEGIKFFIRQTGEKYSDLIIRYKQYLETVLKRPNCDSPILMSKESIVPDLIAEAIDAVPDKCRVWKVIKPAKFEELRIELFDADNKAIDFDKIPVLKQMFPHISETIPFVFPEVYDEWNSISYEELTKMDKTN